jgi:hypothetical protein
LDIEPQIKHKYYGQIKYDDDGNPECHICGRGFARPMNHVRQIHRLSARQYKIMFGLNVNKGIMSEAALDKCRQNVIRNQHRIADNILINGEPTRFKKGESPGRPRNKLSEQSLQRLVQHNKNMTRRK